MLEALSGPCAIKPLNRSFLNLSNYSDISLCPIISNHGGYYRNTTMNKKMNRIQSGKWCLRKSRTRKGTKMIRFLWSFLVSSASEHQQRPSVWWPHTSLLNSWFNQIQAALWSAVCPFLWSQMKSGYAPLKSWRTEDQRQESGLGLGLGSSTLPEMRFHWRGSLARQEGFLWREGGFRFMQEELGSTWANSAVIFGPAQVKDRPIRGQDSCCVTSSALTAFRAV